VTGRVAVVVGGAAGIGAAIARAPAADGCAVTVADRDLEARAPWSTSGVRHTRPLTFR
jgi:NAD(P)-dependent dehydrogenase (short-subunit alcohol dehydrogenase family)